MVDVVVLATGEVKIGNDTPGDGEFAERFEGVHWRSRRLREARALPRQVQHLVVLLVFEVLHVGVQDKLVHRRPDNQLVLTEPGLREAIRVAEGHVA